MVGALSPLLENTRYGRLLNITEILDERKFAQRLHSFLTDNDFVQNEKVLNRAYLEAVNRIQEPSFVVKQALTDG
jgi:hypothetical protein